MSEATDALHRREQRRQLLGDDAACTMCGERNLMALIEKPGRIVCYACDGAASTEAHHIAGQHNLPDTVQVPANEHRILSDLQQDWPKRTLQNPNGSPLLKASGMVRGFLDMLRLLIDRVLGWIPATLEALDQALGDMLGERWWEQPAFAALRGVWGNG